MVEVNPFDDLIVKEPRRPEPVVTGLNERPLEVLNARFERLVAGALPRPAIPADQALLVTSAQPGFGKSHLIGRLFRELHGRATLVYIRPFQNSGLAFQSLLAAVVKEMHFPDRADWSSWKPKEPTQLDALAFGVLAHALADLMERQGGSDASEIARIRRDPVAAFGEGVPGDPWGDWMRQTFEQNRGGYDGALVRRGISLNSADWLRVLLAYGFSYPDRTTRQACLDWIAGRSLSADQADAIGLESIEGLDAEWDAERTNHICRERLVDLCQLAAFYRPFVFCFDQTEAYGHAAGLARTFGMVIATLVNEAANHLTLVTSNQHPWLKAILPHFEDADAQRIAQPAVILEGLTRIQGEQLLRLRLIASATSLEDEGKLLAGNWLGGIFSTEKTRVGAREYLQSCKTRWEEVHRPQPAAPPEPPPAPETQLADLYEARRVKLLAEPKRLLWDADILQWFVKTCPQGFPDLLIEAVASRYFSVAWRGGERLVLFGFEPGSNWKRWEVIARETTSRYEQLAKFKAVFFRGSEQAVVPGPAWRAAPVVRQALRQSLHMIVLSWDEFAGIYAGYDLYAEALGGDIPPHDALAVLGFLRKKFAPWWERFRGPVEIDPETAGEVEKSAESRTQLSDKVRRIVSAEKFLSVDEVIARLGGGWTPEEVLQACGYSAEIRIHAHPQMTVLQWQNI